MPDPARPLPARLRAGERVLSTMVGEIRNPNLARMLATAGLDSFIVDMEHGTFGWPDMAALVTVGRAVGLAPVVRLPEIRRETVLKPLDAGAAGVLVPMVEHAEQVEQLVRLAKYPPRGVRGAALGRGHSDYRKVVPGEYLQAANAESTILIQIETTTALDNLDELLAVDGVDVAFVGPFDLSVSMGIPGQLTDPALGEAYAHVLASCRRHGVAAGIQLFDVDEAARLADDGYAYLSYSSDVNLLMEQITAAAARLRQAPGLGSGQR